jgi:hypothetical protein
MLAWFSLWRLIMPNQASALPLLVALASPLVAGCLVGPASEQSPSDPANPSNPGGPGDPGGPGTPDASDPVTTMFQGGPYRTPIPANPVIDPSSQRFVALLEPLLANTMEFGQVARYATAADPVQDVHFRTLDGQDWGQPFDQVVQTTRGSASCNPLHIPADLAVPTGDQRTTDGWVYIIDTTKPGLVCAIWQARKVDGTWMGSNGGVLDGMGDGRNLAGAISGSRIPHNAILASEIASGSIDHALSFAARRQDPSVFRLPATSTDGQGQPGELQQGMRFQLDPSVDCAALPGSTEVSKVERMVCVALQKYGMYNNDSTAGEASGIVFQTDDPTDPARVPPLQPGAFTRTGGLYSQNGLTYDYFQFSHIPLNQMRLLRSWDGT